MEAETRAILGDENVKKMNGKAERIAQALKNAAEFGNPIIIKYHDDADGVSAAIMIKEALLDFAEKRGFAAARKPWLISEYSSQAVYSREDAVQDVLSTAEEKKPVLLLVDHGINGDSVQALKIVKAGGFKIIAIDHHPPSQEAVEMCSEVLSPFVDGGDSNYTAGLLAFLVAGKISGLNFEHLLFYSLQGDKSRFRKKEEFEEPVVIDFLASHSRPRAKLSYFQKALENPHLSREIFVQSQNIVEEVFRKAQAHVKTEEAGERGMVCLLNFAKLNYEEKFPSKGKIANSIQFKKAEENPGKAVVTIVFGDKTLICRANKEALEMGFSGNEVIGELRREFSEAVSGGGHDAAASMKISGNAKLIAEQFKEKAKAILESG